MGIAGATVLTDDYVGIECLRSRGAPGFVQSHSSTRAVLEASSALFREGELPTDEAVIDSALRIERSRSGGWRVAIVDVIPITNNLSQ